MLNSYCSSSSNDVLTKVLNKTIIGMTHDIQGRKFVLRFEDASEIALRDNGQSCCESRYMTCDDDLSEYLGAKLLDVAEAAGKSAEDRGDYHETMFLKIKTDRGTITVETHNEHNGYYGGFDLICEENQ